MDVCASQILLSKYYMLRTPKSIFFLLISLFPHRGCSESPDSLFSNASVLFIFLFPPLWHLSLPLGRFIIRLLPEFASIFLDSIPIQFLSFEYLTLRLIIIASLRLLKL